VGKSVQYREDNITVSLRMVSVATGEVLLEVLSQKTIFSYGKSDDVFRFIEANTELVEIELGNARNESSTIALMKAIEGGIYEIVKQGYEKGFWVLQNKNEGVKSNDETINKPDCDAECLDNIRG
jgi:curli production assembly/transport component CsgG